MGRLPGGVDYRLMWRRCSDTGEHVSCSRSLVLLIVDCMRANFLRDRGERAFREYDGLVEELGRQIQMANYNSPPDRSRTRRANCSIYRSRHATRRGGLSN